ncbi:hypothetical protein NP493_553g02031 [Ridgeia piscesae]|uniref:Major facilitator superfamily (MFS) profile domain-containing protein n=1 Tax=Ridgeia piscesae TaxID=27915 RepID=A0AAD9KVR7_RIDPI|nr:hypothetical protein NP493_553g02031 [Ridgeia piscesae]
MDVGETRERRTASEEKVVNEPLENRKRALDGGWGWMCLFGCTLIQFLIGFYGRSYGLIYLQLRKRFNSSAALTAWVGGGSLGLSLGCTLGSSLDSTTGYQLHSISSIKASSRIVRWQTPLVVVSRLELLFSLGGLMVGTGCVLNAFATSTEYLIVTYTLMSGFGGSLVVSPSLVVICEYFEKRRGVAVGIAAAGTSVGAILGPPLMTYLFERYGFLSGLLVVGAIMFNCCVGGALCRPLVDNFPDHMTSYRIKLSPECGEETGGHDGRGDAKISYENHRGGAEKEDVPLTSPKSGIDSRNEAGKRIRNRLSWLNRAVGAVRAFGRTLDVSLCPVLMFAPAVSKNIGLSEKQAAFVLSALSSGDLVGRLVSGFFFDLPLVRRQQHRLFSASMLFTAFAILAWHFVTSFTVAMCNATVFGFFMGVVICLKTTMICDLLGEDRLSSSLGMLVFAQGVGILVGPFLSASDKAMAGLRTYGIWPYGTDSFTHDDVGYAISDEVT